MIIKGVGKVRHQPRHGVFSARPGRAISRTQLVSAGRGTGNREAGELSRRPDVELPYAIQVVGQLPFWPAMRQACCVG